MPSLSNAVKGRKTGRRFRAGFPTAPLDPREILERIGSRHRRNRLPSLPRTRVHVRSFERNPCARTAALRRRRRRPERVRRTDPFESMAASAQRRWGLGPSGPKSGAGSFSNHAENPQHEA